MSVFLITGCNRGLGLGLTKEVLRAGHSVIGTCRNPNGERDLWELEDDYPEKLKVLEMDLSSEQSIKEGFGSLPSDQHIDILINNAGILEDFNSGIESLDFDVLLRSFKINTVGSLLVVKHALPFLKKAWQQKIFLSGRISQKQSPDRRRVPSKPTIVLPIVLWCKNHRVFLRHVLLVPQINLW